MLYSKHVTANNPLGIFTATCDAFSASKTNSVYASDMFNFQNTLPPVKRAKISSALGIMYCSVA